MFDFLDSTAKAHIIVEMTGVSSLADCEFKWSWVRTGAAPGPEAGGSNRKLPIRPRMSASAQGIFLSYASQDAEAAERICDALRAAGLEVWFVQSELRGGDAWDASIRKKIKECTLFVPIISTNTESRSEGYFRLE